MADVREIFYDGIRQQVARVMNLLGDERVEKGLTAFENGASTWSHCFFARALAPEIRLNGEEDVARALGLTSTTTKNGLNLVPVRIVYRTFDGLSGMMTKDQLRDLINELRNEGKAQTVPDTSSSMKKANEWLASKNAGFTEMLKKIDFTGVESTPVKLGGPACA